MKQIFPIFSIKTFQKNPPVDRAGRVKPRSKKFQAKKGRLQRAPNQASIKVFLSQQADGPIGEKLRLDPTLWLVAANPSLCVFVRYHLFLALPKIFGTNRFYLSHAFQLLYQFCLNSSHELKRATCIAEINFHEIKPTIQSIFCSYFGRKLAGNWPITLCLVHREIEPLVVSRTWLALYLARMTLTTDNQANLDLDLESLHYSNR